MPSSLSPRLSLAPLFGDQAVLQRDRPLPVWGGAAPGESVAVTLRGRTERTVADSDGRWMVRFRPFAASSEPADLVAVGETAAVTARGVLVGDVWLASGQSNMEWPVSGVRQAAEEMSAANFPLIRHLKVERTVALAPSGIVPTGGWRTASPQSVGDFSAVGYFFAREIHRKLGVPLGIVNSTWGGTPVESWMSDAARRSTSLGEKLEARWRQAMSEWPPERVARYPSDMATWEQAEAKAKASGTPNPLVWPQPPATNDSPVLPGGLYNAMIAPLLPAALRGVLWYQGEANVERPGEYAELFAAMINSWRQAWAQADLPFYFVQLANYRDTNATMGPSWPLLREAQAQALALPATGMAVTIDIGQAEDIHPTNKQDVGRRLALIAEAGTYGQPVDCSGPVFAGATPEGSALRVRFKHTGSHLVAQGQQVQSLELAGADRIFHAATGAIEGATLLVSSPAVPNPLTVRYAWTDAPTANLYNPAGLPAAPFRVDNC
jgi:sialate O-acetylesterase